MPLPKLGSGSPKADQRPPSPEVVALARLRSLFLYLPTVPRLRSLSGWLLRQSFFDGLQEVPDAGIKSHGSLPGVPRSSGGLPYEDLVMAASVEDGWRMGQGTMTDTGGL